MNSFPAGKGKKFPVANVTGTCTVANMLGNRYCHMSSVYFLVEVLSTCLVSNMSW